MPIQVFLADGRPFERNETMVMENETLAGLTRLVEQTSGIRLNRPAQDVTNEGQQLPDRDRTAEPPRTIAVVATELQNAMDAASRVPRLRAELDALLGVVKRVRKASK